MNWSWFEKLLGQYINKSILWVKDGKVRFAIAVVCLFFFSVVVLPKLVTILNGINYSHNIANAYIALYKFANTREFGLLLLGILLISCITIYSLYRTITIKSINIRPDKEPDLWSFYEGSGWSIVEDNDSWNKVLKVTNSSYPSILKFGTNWINYDLYFQVKVPSTVLPQHRNFSVVVRAIDKSNNVFLQCKPDGHISPHVITDGIFLVDDINQIEFLAEYPLDKWIDVRVSVKGDYVTISMMGTNASYKIPSGRYVISATTARAVMNLSEVRNVNIRQPGSIESSSSGSSGQPVFVINMEYEKGTIGFREFGTEAALFRKIKVELKKPY